MVFEYTRITQNFLQIRADNEQGDRLGYVNLKVNSEDIEIIDLFVGRFEKTMLRFFKKVHSYRNQGVGTALVAEAIRYTRAQNKEILWGHANGNMPYLRRWYGNRGFTFNGETLFEMKV